MMSVVNLPMLNSEVVTGVSLMLLFAMAHIQLGYVTLLLSHIAFCVPYVVLSVMPKLRQLDPNLAEAAQDLGATPLQGFFRVILPDIMPGVFSGFIMALTMSIDDFVVSFFTTGSGEATCPSPFTPWPSAASPRRSTRFRRSSLSACLCC